MEVSLEEKTEQCLQEFEERRDYLQSQMVSTFEEIKVLLESAMKKVEQDLEPIMSQTDSHIDTCIEDIQKMLARKREIAEQRQKLTPLLELFKQSP